MAFAIGKLGSATDCIVAKERLAECVADARKKLFELRHKIGQAKVPLILEHLTELIAAGCRKIIVFIHHQDVASDLRTQLQDRGIRTILLNGTVPVKRRETERQLFRSDENIRIAIVGIGAGGQSIDLTVAANVVFGELDWTPAMHFQGEDRAHRIGQRSPVLCQYLAAGSLDKRILLMLEEKAKNVGETLGALKNDDNTWFFPNAHKWHSALWRVDYSTLVSKGERIGHQEAAALRRFLRRDRNKLTNVIDQCLVRHLLGLRQWVPNQIGAAILLLKKAGATTKDGASDETSASS